MSAELGKSEGIGAALRDDPDAFDALRDLTADRLNVDPGAIEKDYWATEVLRSATAALAGLDDLVFKGWYKPVQGVRDHRTLLGGHRRTCCLSTDRTGVEAAHACSRAARQR